MLVNGTRIEGFIVESTFKDYIKIRVADSDPLVVSFHKIRKIKFYPGTQRAQPSDTMPGHTGGNNILAQYAPGIKTKSIFHEVTGSLMFGQGNTNVSLQAVNGYQFNRYVGAGLGLGVDHYDDYSALPLFLEAKGYLFDRKVTPFYFVDLGYAFAWKNGNIGNNYQNFEVDGGFGWQLGLGYQFNFEQGGMVLKFGYKNQSVHDSYSYPNYYTGFTDITNDGSGNNMVDVQEDRVLRRFVVSVGFLF